MALFEFGCGGGKNRVGRSAWGGAPEPAPLWRRLAAVAADAALVGPLWTSAVAALWLRFWLTDDQGAEHALESMTAWLARRRPAWDMVRLGHAVAVRNQRSFGQRLWGIRGVDVRNGGRRTIANVLRQYLFSRAWRWIGTQLMAPVQRRSQQRRAAQAQELAELKAAPAAGAEPAGAEESSAVELTCLEPCGVAAGLVLAEYLPVLFTPRRQRLQQLAAGVMVVRWPPSRTSAPR